MKYFVLSGSTRLQSQSIKVANYIKQAIEDDLKENTFLLNLATMNLKFWDESFWNKNIEFDDNWTIVKQELITSDAIIIVAPEWNGMLPPALNNFFHLATNGELANKPGLIVAVSAGVNGVYPVCELRLNTYKNTSLCYIPQHVIVRNVNNVLNEVAINENNEEDTYIKNRINNSLKVLSAYASGFELIRSNSSVKDFPYPFGM